MTISWILDPAYNLIIFEGVIFFDKVDLSEIVDQAIRIISDEEEIEQFFEAFYDSTDFDFKPYFLCDDWDFIVIDPKNLSLKNIIYVNKCS